MLTGPTPQPTSALSTGRMEIRETGNQGDSLHLCKFAIQRGRFDNKLEEQNYLISTANSKCYAA